MLFYFIAACTVEVWCRKCTAAALERYSVEGGLLVGLLYFHMHCRSLVQKGTVDLHRSLKCYFGGGVEVYCRRRTVELPRSLGRPGQTVAVSQVTLGPGQYFLSADSITTISFNKFSSQCKSIEQFLRSFLSSQYCHHKICVSVNVTHLV